ncbi:MAG: hypothetical protein ACOH18_00265 [Candidatus Saccharimonadaceae bacterium]
MKRFYQLIAAVVVALLAPVLVSAPTLAASTCDVGFTGPDSQNMCTSVETYSCTVNNNNEVTITNSNNQTVASGMVSGGNSTSGSVSNGNGTNFTVAITNASEGEGGVCSATVIVPAVETPPTVVPSATTTPKTTVKALPVTGDDSTLMIAAIAAGIAVGIAGISVAASLVYRRLNAS